MPDQSSVSLRVSSPNILEVSSINTHGLELVIIKSSEETAFAGYGKNGTISKFIDWAFNIRENLLIEATNNRTRERNYYVLYSRLLEGNITDEEFDKELDEHPDNYQINIDKTPSFEMFQEAMRLSNNIMDADSIGKIETLFSFDSKIIDKYCKQIENGTI